MREPQNEAADIARCAGNTSECPFADACVDRCGMVATPQMVSMPRDFADILAAQIWSLYDDDAKSMPAAPLPLAHGFDEFWAKRGVKSVLNPQGFARMVWEASAARRIAATNQRHASRLARARAKKTVK